MYSYSGLIGKLNSCGMTKTDLTQIGVSSRTIAKIAKNEEISNNVLGKIANHLGCNSTDLYREISPNHILQLLRDEKNAKISGGLYHELQIRMTYNSNHIEGSCLSEDQTRLIFETRTIDMDGAVSVDDIIETSNHFRAVNYCIDMAEVPLNEQVIKKMHALLKQGTRDEGLEWFAVGDYKKRPNVIGGRETAKPSEVPARMSDLLTRYNAISSPTIEDIIAFHAEFEQIHPFQDGNGRVGRLIAFKECLRFNIVPFYIEDSKKSYYYRGLTNWNDERGYLIDTCLDGQDAFQKLLAMFDIKVQS